MTRRLLPTLGLCAALAVALSACAGDPWVDIRREAGSLETVGESTRDRVAICHGAGATQADLLPLAARECAKSGRQPTYVGTTKYQCRVLTPHRSYFDCG